MVLGTKNYKYNYRVVAKSVDQITNVLYLQGDNFLEAVKRRSYAMKEPKLAEANIFRTETGINAARGPELIGMVVKSRLSYENITDRIREGIEILTGSPLMEHVHTLPPVKTKSTQVSNVVDLRPTTPASQVEELYKINLKIEQ
jgi:hypothetical protein